MYLHILSTYIVIPIFNSYIEIFINGDRHYCYIYHLSSTKGYGQKYYFAQCPSSSIIHEYLFPFGLVK